MKLNLEEIKKFILKIVCIDVVSVSNYSTCGISNQVFWYEGDQSSPKGKYIPFLSIIALNKTVIESSSKDFKRYVFLHESGHKSTNIVIKTIIFALILTSAIIMILPLKVLLILAFSSNIEVGTLIATLAISLVGYLSMSLMIYLFEFNAEYFALSKMGEEKYLECQRERRDNSDYNRRRKLKRRLHYPSPNLVVRIYNWRNITSDVLRL